MQRFVSLRILSIVGGTALALTLNALPATADSGAGKTGWFAKIDKNGDGAIDRAEFDASRQSIFAGLDSNGDKQISADEWKAGQDKLHQHMRDAASKKTEQSGTTDQTADKSADAASDKTAGKAADTAGDKRQQFAERSQKWFQKIDSNGDGQISASEWQMVSDQRFARLDADKDGKVSADEMKASWKHKPSQTQPTQQ
jgi:hypothetical protein